MKKYNHNLNIKADQIPQFLQFATISKTAVIFLSLDLTVIDFNEVTQAVYQWEREKIINKKYAKWCDQHQISSPLCPLAVQNLLKNSDRLSVENTISIADKQHTLQWNIILNCDDKETPIGIILIGVDITHQKSYMNQIQKLAETSKNITGQDMGTDRTVNDYFSSIYLYLENIIACMPCFVYWKDVNFVYLGCNDLTAKLLRLPSRKDVIGKTDYDIGVPKEIADSYREVDEKIIRTGIPQLNIAEDFVVDGDTKEFLGNKMPIFDQNGKVIGLVGIALDITERRKWEKEILKAKEIAETANQLKSEFIHNMEHDIRTPFAGILGMTNILEGLETDPTKKQMILDIYFCAQELLDYSCGILDFSRIEAGALPVIDQKFIIRDLIKSVELIEIPAATMKGLEFLVEIDSQIPNSLTGDEYRLKRILINLLSNAIKFTPQGYVKFLIKNFTENENTITLQFIVEDSGIGIEKEKLKTLYEKFGRLMPSNQGLYKGQGLGLRVVKQFIEEMGGEIDIKSTFGKGTQFICTLPFKLASLEIGSESEIAEKEFPHG